MTVGLIVILLIVLILFFDVVRSAAGKTELFPLSLLLVLTAIAGLRYDVGVDCHVYREMYDSPSDIRLLALEPVWHYIIAGLRSLGFTSRMWFILTAFAINTLFFYGMKRMSVNFYFSLLLYVAISFGFVETFNIVRQFVAGGILFATFHYVTEKKIWKYVLCIVLASCFHLSALVMLPFLFLLRIKYPMWMLWGGFGVCFLFGRKILDIVLTYVVPQIADYAFYADNLNLEDYSGLLKLFYFLIGCGILAVAPRVMKRFTSGYLFVNAVIIGLVWYFMFLDVQVFTRIMFYFTVYLFVLIPMIARVFTPRTRLLLMPVIVLLFLAVTLKMHWGVPYDYDFLFFY